MRTLELHGRCVSSPYQLIGHDENALTYALGHCLSQSQPLLREVLRRAGVRRLREGSLNAVEVRLQRHEPEDGGFTDIELSLPGRFKLIFEAKIRGGWPTERQLDKYKKRLSLDLTVPLRKLIVLVDQPRSAAQELPASCETMRWAEIRQSVERLAEGAPADSPVWWLDAFLKEVYDMRLDFEDEVWVVPLGSQPICDGSPLCLMDVPRTYGKYIFPTKFNPRRTLFIAFRYDGKLQAVHRILWQQGGGSNYRDFIPTLDAETGIELTGYHLGPPIPLARQPRTGPRLPMNAKGYCDLDLLLSSATISDAVRVTRERKEL